jgi:hypothetical protein
MPEWAAAYNDIFVFVRKFLSSPDYEEITQTNLKDIYEEFKLEQRFHFK